MLDEILTTNFIVSSAAIFVVFIILMAYHKHFTATFGVSMIIFATIAAVIPSINNNMWHNIALAAVALLFCSAFIYFLWCKNHKMDENNKKIGYLDFSKSVMSWGRIFNNISFALSNKISNGRVIGKILPYNSYQLKYNFKALRQSNISCAGATMISGSIGSGKTYGMKSLIKQNIAAGHSVIFAEYKGDNDLVRELENFAKRYNYEVFTIANGKSNFNYDPLINLNNVGRIEAILNMRKWDISGSDAHYKTGTQLVLQKLVGEFSHVWEKMVRDGEARGKSFTMEFHAYLKKYNPTREEWDSYTTVNKLLELLMTSSLEPMFSYKMEKTLNFREMSKKKYLMIVSFVSSNKELATSFSSLMFKDILDECTVNTPNKNLFLYIDEFGTLENPFIIKDILEKGRSGRIATTLALQDINQIVIQTNEAYLNSILGIINTFIIYSGATRVTAEKFAGVQLHDIETVLMNLKKPINGKKPTAIIISKYPLVHKNVTSEVYRFQPYIFTGKDGNDSNDKANKPQQHQMPATSTTTEIQPAISDSDIIGEIPSVKEQVIDITGSEKVTGIPTLTIKEQPVEQKAPQKTKIEEVGFNFDDFI